MNKILNGIITISVVSALSSCTHYFNDDIEKNNKSIEETFRSKNTKIENGVVIVQNMDDFVESYSFSEDTSFSFPLIDEKSNEIVFCDDKDFESLPTRKELYSFTLKELKSPTKLGIDFIKNQKGSPSNESLNKLSEIYNLPNGLLYSVMLKESSGLAWAESHKGAKGLFQFIPSTAKDFGLITENNDYRTDEWRSAEAAARYLSWLFIYLHKDKEKSDINNYEYVLAAYNAGLSKVKKGNKLQIPNYKETKDYIKYIIGHVNGDFYIIKKGDLLHKIAKSNKLTNSEIKKLNEGVSQQNLKAGAYLLVNKSSKYYNQYTVKKGDSLYALSVKYDVAIDDIKFANNLSNNIIGIGQKITIPF